MTECNECGEVTEASDEEELERCVHQHYEDRHPDTEASEDDLRQVSLPRIKPRTPEPRARRVNS